MNVQESSSGVRVTIQVKTRSQKPGVTVDSDGTVTLRVAAVPERNRANREVVRWFAKKFQKPTSQIKLVTGLHSNTKVIAVLGVTLSDVEKVLGTRRG